MKRRNVLFMPAVLAGLVLAGCSGQQQKPWDTLENCKAQNTELSLQNQDLEIQNRQLKQMVASFLELDKEVRLEAVDTLEKIQIVKRTGFYDKNNDGRNETLVIYLKPIDTAQDTVKAPGKANVQLWNLNAPEDSAKRAEWTVEPTDLHTAWGGTIFDAYYRIKLPLDITPDPQTEYTLKVVFTDYITGKVLTDQTALSAVKK